MTLEQTLQSRSNNQCELCADTNNLSIYELPPHAQARAEDCIYICQKCDAQLEKKETLDKAHWKCLLDSMWSEVPAVQVVSWRLLSRLRDESWATDALDLLYFDDEMLNWAKATGDHELSAEVEFHKDCNGTLLQNGDTVVLIKSLDVKGSSVNARLGTVIKNIRLVHDNTEQIEGKIESQTIVILTKYVRKG
ncbi:MAG TPA: PhnA domain-containing protein [Chitinophagales bacterium]|nr:PhnA domain-containing protein [Chitinophagales bacterium]HNA38466.1 PhnA domain-containing protein [Chitinophagales bacterium]HNF51511.1 PhnA domain-containing protein [Chitinophagales bacterium]HNG72100.1 PhnA domain-containing protein [Chitinophagales bacterium]